MPSLSVLALCALCVVANPTPELEQQQQQQQRRYVHELPVARSHLVSRSTSRQFNPAAIQQDLEKATKHAVRNKARYAKWLQLHAGDKQKRSAPVYKDPFDVALFKRHQKRAGDQTSVSLTGDVVYGQDNSYFGNVGIGTPTQTLSIDFDTGSSDLWVPDQTAVDSTSSTASTTSSSIADELPPLGGDNTTGTDSAHTPFQTGQSSTFKASTTPFSITYGSGAASGDLASDTVQVGDLSVSNQVFAVVDSYSSSFAQVPFDGLMGMGFSTIAETKSLTFFENLVKANKLASNVFSFRLGRGSQDSSVNTNGESLVDNAGTLIIGGVDSSTYTGNIAYQKITTEGYWETGIGGVEVDGKTVSGTSSLLVAWDTGTSLAYVPSTVASSIASALGAQLESSLSSSIGGDGYILPCSDFDSGLKLSISFGGTSFDWQDIDLNGGTVDRAGKYCFLNIIGSDSQDPVGNPVAIVGDAFLKNVISIYDYEGSRVGLAAASSSSSSSSASSSAGSSSNASSDKTSSGASALGLSSCLMGLGTAALFFLAR